VNHKAPERRHPDILALAYAEKILGAGESATLWRRLVKDEEKALSLSVSVDERRGPSLVRVFSIARPGVPLADVEAEIEAAFARLAAEGPTEAEMERARRMLSAELVRGTQTTQSIAFLLTEYALYDGDPEIWRVDVERLLAVDRAAVREACARTFTPERRSVVEVRPESAP
jgi:predicted Zn-dependent peptidase